MKTYFVDQAEYQRWANNELFASLDQFSDAQRRQDMGLFFHDIHKTVDHILVVTRNWKARLAGEFDKVTSYDALLHNDWNALKAAVDDEFQFLGEWLFAQKASAITYPGSDGNPKEVAVADGLIHIMTHAVHHRGQLSAACTQLHAPSPKMDFVFYRWRK
ncbi:MAG: DinB family protein [Gammaproteobacteria bacterium]|nr:MAG: DinB family protein [Gammaproteobacteria bacterium]